MNVKNLDEDGTMGKELASPVEDMVSDGNLDEARMDKERASSIKDMAIDGNFDQDSMDKERASPVDDTANDLRIENFEGAGMDKERVSPVENDLKVTNFDGAHIDKEVASSSNQNDILEGPKFDLSESETEDFDDTDPNEDSKLPSISSDEEKQIGEDFSNELKPKSSSERDSDGNLNASYDLNGDTIDKTSHFTDQEILNGSNSPDPKDSRMDARKILKSTFVSDHSVEQDTSDNLSAAKHSKLPLEDRDDIMVRFCSIFLFIL